MALFLVLLVLFLLGAERWKIGNVGEAGDVGDGGMLRRDGVWGWYFRSVSSVSVSVAIVRVRLFLSDFCLAVLKYIWFSSGVVYFSSVREWYSCWLVRLLFDLSRGQSRILQMFTGRVRRNVSLLGVNERANR